VWTGSWTAASGNSSVVSAISAMIRVIYAASAHDARGRTSHNLPVAGSSPARPTCGFMPSPADSRLVRGPTKVAALQSAALVLRSHRATAEQVVACQGIRGKDPLSAREIRFKKTRKTKVKAQIELGNCSRSRDQGGSPTRTSPSPSCSTSTSPSPGGFSKTAVRNRISCDDVLAAGHGRARGPPRGDPAQGQTRQGPPGRRTPARVPPHRQVAHRQRRPDQHLKRQYGWDRTRLDGTSGARIWAGHGVLAHNLVKIRN
jgi:hypothetical protein